MVVCIQLSYLANEMGRGVMSDRKDEKKKKNIPDTNQSYWPDQVRHAIQIIIILVFLKVGGSKYSQRITNSIIYRFYYFLFWGVNTHFTTLGFLFLLGYNLVLFFIIIIVNLVAVYIRVLSETVLHRSKCLYAVNTLGFSSRVNKA